MIHDVLESRQREAAHAMARQASAPQYDDAIAWAEAEAMNEAFDPAVFQLTLSLAAIHTTSDLLTTTLLLLAERPQLIPPLREEMQQVLRAQGWSKNALYNLKLLDSAIKEAQRKKPNTFSK
jgi:cytochrome P450 monooxygenase-2